jgi:hypothetical protein
MAKVDYVATVEVEVDGKTYQPGDSLPEDVVTEELLRSGAVGTTNDASDEPVDEDARENEEDRVVAEENEGFFDDIELDEREE